jgi:L-erythrulose 1-phosphate isomerase
MTRKIPWLGTNWKMHKTRAEAHAFAETLKASPFADSDLARLFIIPPMPWVEGVASIMRGTRVAVGVQNMHWADHGAYTGEVSPPMACEIGATLAEIGHSERRQYFNETDDGVARKTAAAVKHGMLALVCIGDSRAEYDAGAAADALARQTRFALRDVGKAAIGNVVLAYEPVWSIGENGIPADPEFANQQHRRIKEVSADVLGEPLPVVYGGSVNPQNCCELITKPYIDGLFIGRSAWHAPDFIAIIETVTTLLGEPT